MNPFHFLIEIVFNLYLMVVLLRFWLQLARADFYNPLSQFVVKATSPVLNPLRKVIPGFGGVDVASLVLAFAVAFAKFSLIGVLFAGFWDPLMITKASFMSLLAEGFQLLFWVLIIRAIMSWVVQGYNPIANLLAQLTEPMLRPIRRVIPPIGGLDLSIMILGILLLFISNTIQYYF